MAPIFGVNVRTATRAHPTVLSLHCVFSEIHCLAGFSMAAATSAPHWSARQTNRVENGRAAGHFFCLTITTFYCVTSSRGSPEKRKPAKRPHQKSDPAQHHPKNCDWRLRKWAGPCQNRTRLFIKAEFHLRTRNGVVLRF